ncbi:MAG: hypothetical protein QG573_634 [Acidobacteriota bacterium]|nr:hypothetical protein [Acidobacteriota bacterium]
MTSSRSAFGYGAAALCALLCMSSPLAAQGSGTGDVFGDLIHILRAPATGQPVLAQRWVELPGPVTGYGWGYCPIAVDAFGAELAFIPYTCDPLDLTAVQEVDYFGRLNASRTKERNIRMHMDEVIATIQLADWVDSSGCGRLRLYFDCTVPGDPATCLDSKLIDSPLENLGLFMRLAKYGHLQTDPEEIDTGSHGDPTVPIVYHPALTPEDWPKMAPAVRHLLPANGQGDCFPGGVFSPACAEAELLDDRDLVRAAGFAAGGADKDGHFTVDLVQYLGRIMKLTQATESTVPTLSTLPALARDCWPGIVVPPDPPEPDPNPVDPPYLPPAECEILPADSSLPNFDLFPEVQERFVDFGAIAYERDDWRSELVRLILPIAPDLYQTTPAVKVVNWVAFRNGPDGPTDIAGFVLAANDSLRWIEFIHEYEVPADLFTGADINLFRDGFEGGNANRWGRSNQPGLFR